MALNTTGKAQGNYNTVGASLGIAALAGQLLGNTGLFGGMNRMPPPNADPQSQFVNRRELDYVQQLCDKNLEIAKLEASKNLEIATLQSNKYTDNAVAGVNASISAQAVWNATQQANIQALQNQIQTAQRVFGSLATVGITENHIIKPGTDGNAMTTAG